MPNWLCILNRENFEIIKENFVWGVSERHKNVLNKAKSGDLCAFYLINEGIGKEPSIGGIFEVTSETYIDFSNIFPSKRTSIEVYPYRLKLKPIHIFKKELRFRPLISTLSFIINKNNYAGHLQGKAMINISSDDMKIISESAKMQV